VLVTVPLPDPVRFTLSAKLGVVPAAGGAVKVAPTLTLPVITKEQAPVPEHTPDHPANDEEVAALPASQRLGRSASSGSGCVPVPTVATRVTTVPAGY
jgi:hypothetical protein